MEGRNHVEAVSSASGNNGGRDWSARSTPESEEGRVERRVSDRAARALSLRGRGTRQRVARSLDARRPWGARSGAWLPRCHFDEHVARAMEPDLESIFGIFRAHSDLGASIKVALLWMLYKLD